MGVRPGRRPGRRESVAIQANGADRGLPRTRTGPGSKGTDPKIHIITLAVGKLERALAFYRDGLGLESSGIVGSEYHDDRSGAEGAIVMLHLEDNLTLLLPRTRFLVEEMFPSAREPPGAEKPNLGGAMKPRRSSPRRGRRGSAGNRL